MDLLDFVPELITAFTTSLVTWLFARKKNSAEVESLELDNVDKATGIWRELAEDLKTEIDSLRVHQNKMIAENQTLIIKITNLTTQNEQLTKEVKKLETKVQALSEKSKR